MKKGFTLVELSIVLVIIGLLIGGILAAQSMISTARVQRTVRQLQQYEAALNNFKTKYNSLPGDSTAFPNPGDNNALIDGNEAGAFWNHMSLGLGIKNSKGNDYQESVGMFWTGLGPDMENYYATFDSDATGAAGYFPLLAPGSFDDSLFASPPGWFIGMVSIYKPNINYWIYGKYTLTDGSYMDPFQPKTALAIDTKIDDGNPSGGKVLGVSASGNRVPCANGSGQYDLSASAVNCSLFIEFGINGAPSASQ